jgi:hypothetical protein
MVIGGASKHLCHSNIKLLKSLRICIYSNPNSYISKQGPEAQKADGVSILKIRWHLADLPYLPFMMLVLIALEMKEHAKVCGNRSANTWIG